MDSELYFHCANCKSGIEIRPIYLSHKGTTYNAVAVFTFSGGTSGKRNLRTPEAGGCQILYEGREYANPSLPAVEILGYQENGWRVWKHRLPSGKVVSIDELTKDHM